MTSLNNPMKSVPLTKVVLCILFAAIYIIWKDFVIAITDFDNALHSMLTKHIDFISSDPLQYASLLVAVSFLSITLKFNLAEVQKYGSDVAVVSYVLITLLGTVLIATSAHRLKKLRVSNDNAAHHHHNEEHDHGSECSCKHTHVLGENESKWKALMMGLGTGLSISMISIAAQYARYWLEHFATVSNSIGTYSNPSVSHYIRFIGGSFLVVLDWSLYKASTLTFISRVKNV